MSRALAFINPSLGLIFGLIFGLILGTLPPLTSARAETSYQNEGKSIRVIYYSEVQAARTPDLSSMWNLITLGFRLSESFQLEAQTQNTLSYAGESHDSQWSLGNPRVGFSTFANLSDEWSIWANLNLEPPLTSASRSVGLGVSPGSCQILHARLGASPLGLGLQHWVRYYPYSTDLYWFDVMGNVRPSVTYALSSSVSLQTRVSLNYNHIKSWGWVQTSKNDLALEPGLVWKPMSALSIEPFVSLSPASDGSPFSPARANSWSVGAWITGFIL